MPRCAAGYIFQDASPRPSQLVGSVRAFLGVPDPAYFPDGSDPSGGGLHPG